MKHVIPLFITYIFATNAFGWGAPDLLPSADRTKTYNLDTKLDKKMSFQKLVIWSAKTFANSNESIKMKDPEMGVLVAKGNISCKALKLGSGFAENQRVDFTLEITVDNKKAEAKISELVGRAEGAYDSGARPSNKEEMESTVNECIDPFVDTIKKELS